jgi:hypothetical protein
MQWMKMNFFSILQIMFFQLIQLISFESLNFIQKIIHIRLKNDLNLVISLYQIVGKIWDIYRNNDLTAFSFLSILKITIDFVHFSDYSPKKTFLDICDNIDQHGFHDSLDFRNRKVQYYGLKLIYVIIPRGIKLIEQTFESIENLIRILIDELENGIFKTIVVSLEILAELANNNLFVLVGEMPFQLVQILSTIIISDNGDIIIKVLLFILNLLSFLLKTNKEDFINFYSELLNSLIIDELKSRNQNLVSEKLLDSLEYFRSFINQIEPF